MHKKNKMEVACGMAKMSLLFMQVLHAIASVTRIAILWKCDLVFMNQNAWKKILLKSLIYSFINFVDLRQERTEDRNSNVINIVQKQTENLNAYETLLVAAQILIQGQKDLKFATMTQNALVMNAFVYQVQMVQEDVQRVFEIPMQNISGHRFAKTNQMIKIYAYYEQNEGQILILKLQGLTWYKDFFNAYKPFKTINIFTTSIEIKVTTSNKAIQTQIYEFQFALFQQLPAFVQFAIKIEGKGTNQNKVRALKQLSKASSAIFANNRVKKVQIGCFALMELIIALKNVFGRKQIQRNQALYPKSSDN